MASLVARRALRGLAARGSRLAAAGDSAPVVCLNGSRTFADATDASLKRTVLWDYHTKNKGKMVPFAGWSMPVLYDGESLIESVKNCRRGGSGQDGAGHADGAEAALVAAPAPRLRASAMRSDP